MKDLFQQNQNTDESPYTYTVSDLILYLQKIQKEHGNIPVTTQPLRGGVQPMSENHMGIRHIAPKAPHDRLRRYAAKTDGSIKVLNIG